MAMSDPIARREQKPQPPIAGVAWLQLAFRPFFLLGALFGMACLLLWSGMLTGVIEPVVYGGPLWWHMHEMLFGFVAAIVVGFLLTAVQTWTGIPGIKGAYLLGLVTLWLSARVLLVAPTFWPQWAIVMVDLTFLPAAALVLGHSIVKVQQWRNIVFVPLLLALALINGAMHWSVYANAPELPRTAGTVAVLLLGLLMSTMAGRVVPMFTANGTQTRRVADRPWLERTALLVMLFAVLAGAGLSDFSPPVSAGIMFLAATVLALRGLRWRIWVTARVPLLWSLHISYWCIPLGLFLLGLSLLSTAVSHSQAIHTLTVGAMGMMILAMISRVSLGHTGRPMVVGKVMTGAFVAAFIAFLVRVFGPYSTLGYSQLIVTAVMFWVLAYGCFLVLYLPILTRPRVDGRPG